MLTLLSSFKPEYETSKVKSEIPQTCSYGGKDVQETNLRHPTLPCDAGVLIRPGREQPEGYWSQWVAAELRLQDSEAASVQRLRNGGSRSLCPARDNHLPVQQAAVRPAPLTGPQSL